MSLLVTLVITDGPDADLDNGGEIADIIAEFVDNLMEFKYGNDVEANVQGWEWDE